MNISNIAIVSNTDMIKNYKDCREKVEDLNKIFIIKNNKPDAVLFSITQYQKLSEFIEYIERLEEKEITKLIQSLPKEGIRERETVEQLIKDLQKNDEILIDNLELHTNDMHDINKDLNIKIDNIKNESIDSHDKIIKQIQRNTDKISNENNKS